MTVVAFETQPRVEIVDEFVVTTPDLTLIIQNPTITQAPSSFEVLVAGGQPETEATIDIDGVDVLDVVLDTNGGWGGTVPLDGLLGTAGVHTVTITQVALAGTLTGSGDITVLGAPIVPPTPPPADGDPTLPPAAIVAGHPTQRWVLQDPRTSGGIGSYVFPQNPQRMNSPHFQRVLASRRTMRSVKLGGKYHVYEAAGQPKDWEFSGYAPTEAFFNKLIEFRDLNRRFWLIDHRNRAWKVVFLNVDHKPRLQHNYNGVVTDWGADYTVTALILDQHPTEPS